MSGTTTPEYGAPQLAKVYRLPDGKWNALYEWILPPSMQAPLSLGDPNTREAELSEACAKANAMGVDLAAKLREAHARVTELGNKLDRALTGTRATDDENTRLTREVERIGADLVNATVEARRHKALAERMQRDAELGDIAMPPSHFNPMGQLTWAERERALVAQVRGLEAKVAYLEAKHGKA